MKKLSLMTAVAFLAFTTPAFAQSAGSWTGSVGGAVVDPKTDNGALDDGTALSVGSNTQLSLTGEYFIKDNLGIEVLASTPFRHDVSIPGAGEVAETSQLPPTVTLQYHFGSEGSQFRPFLGAGANYTIFFNEDTSGALTGTDLNIKNSFGFTARAGLDIWLNDNMALRADVRWIDLSPEIELDGADVGSVDIDPFVYGVSLVRKF